LRPFLEVIGGAAAQERFFLAPGATTIGRSSDATITLVDDRQLLSRVHARLERRDREVSVVGEGANGTAVDGCAVGREPRMLREGDVLVLAGKIKLRFGWTAAEDGRAPADHHVPSVDQAPPPRRRRALPFLLGSWGAVWVSVVLWPTESSTQEDVRTTRDILRVLAEPVVPQASENITAVVRAIASHPDRTHLTGLLRRALLLEQQRDRAAACRIWRQVALRCASDRDRPLARHARAEFERLTR
jgi:pSer/pThr/pTyr-binding forkhead associated (FHA) protein